MAYQNDNFAYDLSLFEEKPRNVNRKNNVVKIPKEKLKSNKKSKAKLLPAVTMTLSFMIVIMTVSAMVYSQVQLTELTEQINTSNCQLNEQESIYTQTQMKVESKLSLRAVEDYSKQSLNMKKTEPSQIEYIRLSSGDKAEIKNMDNKSVSDKVNSFILKIK